MRISAILAMANHRVIGNNNQLPWRLPADLRRFKVLTLGKPVIMGRKTYDSIGRPLPSRHNIVVTRNTDLELPGCTVVTSIEAALQSAAAGGVEEVFIIGGEHLYRETLPKVQRIYLTEVEAEVSGDTFFPELTKSAWREIARETHASDVENEYGYSFVILERVAGM